MQCSIWEDIEPSCDEEILKEKYPMYNINICITVHSSHPISLLICDEYTISYTLPKEVNNQSLISFCVSSHGTSQLHHSLRLI